ncbi:N-acetylmuramoyl-L-alanine amidase [Alkalihalobacillus sp. 1P02AB]|uniref:N-acetylmuramoyl-L-alanine amidase n=1 Tax=Alkalihalobacillus sp. 1P02AB TaxID=3132260 RepID=UPI0039A6AD46
MRNFYIITLLFSVTSLIACSNQEVVEVQIEASPATVAAEVWEYQAQVIDWFLPVEHSKERVEEITHIMLHFTNNASRNTANPYDLDEIYQLFIEYEVSAHYMIDRDGDVYMLVPEDRVAFHAGQGTLEAYPEYENQLNEYSIGIELLGIGTKEEMVSIMTDEQYEQLSPETIGFTMSQYRSLNELLADIYQRNSEIKRDRIHLIGHDEYAPERKFDPGSLFEWEQIQF